MSIEENRNCTCNDNYNMINNSVLGKIDNDSSLIRYLLNIKTKKLVKALLYIIYIIMMIL